MTLSPSNLTLSSLPVMPFKRVPGPTDDSILVLKLSNQDLYYCHQET